jgi:uridine kinase
VSRVTVRLNGQTYQVPPGTPVHEVLGHIYVQEHRVIGAALNNHLVALDTPIDGDAVVRPVTPEDPDGEGILRRTAALALHSLLAARHPELSFCVGQSLFNGYFYEVERADGGPLDLEELAADLNAGLARLAREDRPLVRRRVSVEAAERLLGPTSAKARLLRAWATAVVPLVELDEFVDIQHGPCAPGTGCLEGVRVVAYPPGLVLLFHPQDRPGEARRLFEAYRETREWNRLIGVATVADLNQAVLEDRIPEVVRVAEALHEKKIAEIADQVAARRARAVFVAGPSASGKTTFVRRLAVQLQVNGLQPRLLSLDDYYRDRADCPRDAAGEIDYEALEALDLPLLQKHLSDLAAGQEVRVPRFDFVRGRRTDPESWRPLRVGPGQVLLVEGIHGLNPRVTGSVPGEAGYRVFINALTQLVIDEHNRIQTSDARLLRRLVRDRRYRGSSATETIERWASVRRGEERLIFPYQEQCDTMFNSALVYETAVLKSFAWRYLLEVPRTQPARVQAYQMLKFLDLFVPFFPDAIPANSVLREFIGGSGFLY